MMKRLYSLAFLGMLLLVFSTQLSAQTSSLVVFNEFREDFTLYVNGQRINPIPAQHVRVTALKPGRYTVEAIFQNPGLPQQLMEIQIEMQRETSYALVRSEKGRGDIRFMFLSEYSTGYIPIAPQAIVSFDFTGQPTPNNTLPPQQPITLVPNPQIGQIQPITTVNPLPNPLPGYTGPLGCEYPMDPVQFQEAKKTVASKSFSDTKMQLAKQITRSNCLLTSQVIEFMTLFSFESQKLEFAKFAYDFTYDRGNYYRINDAFGFESSIRDLEKYLQGRQ